MNVYRLLERAASYRPGTRRDLVSVTKFTLRMLARRALALEAEIAELDAILGPLVAETAPALIARPGIGTETASALLVAAGDNPERLRTEATFAHLCGVAPLDASSAKHLRHRLNRGGDRQANAALWRIIVTRMVCDPDTRAYIERRMKDGKTKRKPSAASSATSPARSTTAYPTNNSPLTTPRSIDLGQGEGRLRRCGRSRQLPDVVQQAGGTFGPYRAPRCGPR